MVKRPSALGDRERPDSEQVEPPAIDRRLDRIEAELAGNTRSTVRMEAVLDELVVPHVRTQMAKLDACLQYIAASSHLPATVTALGGKIDGLGRRFDEVEKEQAITTARIGSVEHRLEIAETAKVRGVAASAGERPWWLTAKGVGAVVAAVAAAIATVIAATTGGCV